MGEAVTTFPFSAIVGQDSLKEALLLAAVDRSIGGVLAFGDRGTGKSTVIRALASLLSGDGARVVDLPLGATEDRIVGALDLEAALVRGEKKFQSGLLADADQGFLYIDEVNLLEDHLVDILLDVAASGENVVEREGLSVRHPARFVLVGSGNPEEGELRPQLLDRFGLAVDIRTPTNIAERIEIVRRRDAFERDPDSFVELWRSEDDAIAVRVRRARAQLDSTATPDDILEQVAKLCIALGTDGLRAELTLMRAARAKAALSGDAEVTIQHVRDVAPAALRHRLRKDALDDTDAAVRVERSISETLGP